MENKENQNVVVLDENGFIPGTNYKSVDELVKGHSNLKDLADRQGNELGTWKKQAETLADTLKSSGGNSKKETEKPAEQTRDFDAEEAAVDDQIAKLDPADDAYQSKLSQLVKKGRQITAARQHEQTLGAAGQIFKQELDERDIKATHKAFLDANPTFNTPEMQTRINDAMKKDTTGMLDPMAAFYQIQRDDALAVVRAADEEKTELQKKLELAEGKKRTGTVITKGQPPGAPTNTQTRLSGKEADEGALAALRTARGET